MKKLCDTILDTVARRIMTDEDYKCASPPRLAQIGIEIAFTRRPKDHMTYEAETPNDLASIYFVVVDMIMIPVKGTPIQSTAHTDADITELPELIELLSVSNILHAARRITKDNPRGDYKLVLRINADNGLSLMYSPLLLTEWQMNDDPHFSITAPEVTLALLKMYPRLWRLYSGARNESRETVL